MCLKGCEFSQIHLNNFELFRKLFSTLFHQVVIQHHQTVPESISHSYVSNDRPVPTIPIEYDVLSPNQCYEKQNYVKTHSSHVMSGPYESLGQYDVISKQTNESLKQQCEKALHELNQLRRQHTETSRRCEHVMKVGDIYQRSTDGAGSRLHRATVLHFSFSCKVAFSLKRSGVPLNHFETRKFLLLLCPVLGM